MWLKTSVSRVPRATAVADSRHFRGARPGGVAYCHDDGVWIKNCTVLLLSFTLLACFPLTAAEIMQTEKIDIAKVWAGHPVDFAIKTANNFQYVAYYDSTRRMVVAERTIGSNTWSYTVLPTTTGWDSHNYIEMAIDDSGYIHVSGNMHNASSLVYFRSKKPWAIESFSTPGMIGTQEGSITYPVFIKGGENQLIFQYRDGGSGSGTTIWNGYDVTTKKWRRITSQGLLDGEGQVNAYQTSPVPGPDGFFHIIWMWRNTPVANTNHHLSHMKSKNLSTWLTMAGAELTMPVKQSTPGVVVDPVESGHGLINMDFWISWDTRDRAVVTYHRYDDDDISQIFNTRWEGNAWKIRQTSGWTGFKWNLDREGSLSHDIAASPLTVDESGALVQNYIYRNSEVRRWVLDEATLTPKSDGIYEPPEAMKELYVVESQFPGMQINRKQDGEYYLRWETMPINQDKERASGTYPSSSMLRVYRFTAATSARNGLFLAASGGIALEKDRHRIVISRLRGVSGYAGPFSAALFTIDGRFVAGQSSGNAGCCVIPLRRLQRGIYIIQVIPDPCGNDEPEALLTERLVIY
ncbi:MAG: BNR repeat-containing protein [Chitinispirillaceae bacterium]|nr:BNR repeat-containing protein [Chitinispirillaceae bacterium]